MLLPNRYGNSADYRYGAFSKEQDYEINGVGNSYNFGSRLYSPRVVRWLSTDPKQEWYPFYSPYNYAANCPISVIDTEGEFLGVIIGAVVGAAINGTIAAIKGEDIGYAMAKGALAGAAAGGVFDAIYTGGASLAVTVAAGAAAGATGNAVEQVIDYTVRGDDLSGGEFVASTVIGGVTAGIGHKIAPFISKFTKKAGKIFTGPLQRIWKPSDFGVKTISESPELLRVWNANLKRMTESNRPNLYKDYLSNIDNGIEMSNDFLRSVFKSVRGGFKNMAKKEGMEISGEIHHWNFPAKDFPLDVVNPSNLTEPISRELHEYIHQTVVSEGVNLWTGPMAPQNVIPTQGTPLSN